MRLALHYSSTAQRPAVAAFLAGAEPLAWLRELSRWHVSPDKLACYVVPASVQSVQAAGLLVVPADAAMLPADCREPYGVVASRLYLPTHADVRPAATEAELHSQLLYVVQFFHPTIGLVGFEASDQVCLADLLTLGPPQPADWSWAQPGPALPPPLRQIKVLAPTLDEILNGGLAEVGTAPLTDLPGRPDPPSPLQKALDDLKVSALRTGLAATQGLLGSLAALSSGLASPGSAGSSSAPNRGRPTTPAGPGIFERLNNYFAGSLHNLEQKRHNEMERLLDLFDQNMEEALRFAIPLDSPYQHRGTAAPGSQLGPRSTDFNLRELGGGQRVDGWDLSQYQSQLRTQYQRAAEQEAAAGRAKKAAYIYAHLLGDYRTAAQALAAGGHCREAAVLYQEHLHDLASAAAVLEQGGLLPEAIDLYSSLNEFEKVGDLYQQLGQPTPAIGFYEQAALQARTVGDTLRAARLLADKLARPAEAEALLLAGWNGSRQPEAHLASYLQLLATTRPATLPAALRDLYQLHTPPSRRSQLLEALLAGLPTRATDPALQATVQELGFEIISQEAQAGDLGKLHLLKKLLPQDPLLAGDASRYTTRQRAR